MTNQPQSRKNRLPLALDISQLIGGLLILVITITSAFVTYHVLSAIFEITDRGEPQPPLTYSTSAVLFLLIYSPIMLLLVGAGLLSATKAVRSLLIPDPPTSGSRPFRDYDEFRRGLQEHALSYYKPLGAFVSAILGARTMYLSPFRRTIVTRNGEKVKVRLVWTLAAALFVLLVHQGVKNAWFLDYKLAIPFALLIGLSVLLASVEFLSSLLLVPREEPAVESHEALEYYKGFGHPTNLFSRLPDLGEELRLGEQPNRIYVTKTEKATAAVSDVGEFSGMFYIERQPVLHDQGRREAAYVLLLAGWLLQLIGCSLFSFSLLPMELHTFVATGVAQPFSGAAPFFILLMLLPASSAWLNGRRYCIQASDLSSSLRFRSVGMLINVTGELARADIKIGGAGTDSMESSNVGARSNFTARFWAAELISEARSPTESRELLALNRTEVSANWIDSFRKGIHRLREDRIRPVGIEIDSGEASEISRANAGLFAERVRMMQPSSPDQAPIGSATGSFGQLSAAGLAVPEETRVAAPKGGVEDSKECPECAEIVRARAKKCRYCGHQFEGS